MLKVGDRTIVDHLISDVARSGKIDEYVIVTNHRFAPHFSWWADGEASGVDCPDDSWPRRCSDIASERITVLDDGTSTNDTRLGAVKDILFAIDKLHIDDELLVLAEDTVATHRIVEVLPDENDPAVVRFRTKGDANAAADGALVHCNNVIGTPVLTIPLLGYFVEWVRRPPGLYAALGVVAVLVLLAFLPDLAALVRGDPKKD